MKTGAGHHETSCLPLGPCLSDLYPAPTWISALLAFPTILTHQLSTLASSLSSSRQSKYFPTTFHSLPVPSEEFTTIHCTLSVVPVIPPCLFDGTMRWFSSCNMSSRMSCLLPMLQALGQMHFSWVINPNAFLGREATVHE